MTAGWSFRWAAKAREDTAIDELNRVEQWAPDDALSIAWRPKFTDVYQRVCELGPEWVSQDNDPYIVDACFGCHEL